MEWTKLLGLLVIVAGFALRLNTLAVVLAAGLVTGLIAGMSVNEIIGEFGRAFAEGRYITLALVLTLPVIGLLERHGLRERAEILIRRFGGATAGRVILLYQAVREVTIALGVPIGAHAGMVRPLVVPMAEAAEAAHHGPPDQSARADIRAHAAAAENTGNFFAEDICIGVGAILVMKQYFDSVGVPVGVWSMAFWGFPTAIWAFGVGWWRCRRLDARLATRANRPREVAAP